MTVDAEEVLPNRITSLAQSDFNVKTACAVVTQLKTFRNMAGERFISPKGWEFMSVLVNSWNTHSKSV